MLNLRIRRICYPTVRKTFMRLLQQAGIPWDPRKGPRIHPLRHTFAVHRWLACYREGEDVNARLPALATYMGHVNIASTHVSPVNPHTFRHTTAMHLLRSGNDIHRVSDWLGHANLNTTHVYLEIDMETKRKMLAKTDVPSIRKQAPWHKPHILKWLDQLTKSPVLCAVSYPSNPKQRSQEVFNST